MKETVNYNKDVAVIKEAILRSQYKAVSVVNSEQLSLYYSIGKYVSENSRDGFWGTGAIERISKVLQKELPGLRGFSATNMKNMRIFYEEWSPIINQQMPAAEIEVNRQPTADDLKINENLLLAEIRQPTADEFNRNNFLKIGFSLHMEILFKAKSLDARLFYIHECATRFWNKYTLRDYLRADLYNKRGTMPSNFAQTLPNVKQVLKAVAAFKDEYLLDYINVEQIDEQDEDQDERMLEHAIVNNIKKFIMTFGDDFSFIGNQYRIAVDGEESFIDLLFFNRELNALVAVELKTGKFRPSYLGQLNFYLSALDEYVRKPHENQSIGIILCKEMKKTTVEFAIRDFTKPMGVATYKTSNELPENMRKALPDMEDLKRIMNDN
jgi:predicted nuclease of restriction endonuclease-like (RecB) superfamily